jgi:hypothetical protein
VDGKGPPPEDTATAREEREVAARDDGAADDETAVRNRERGRTDDYERTRSD